MQNHFAQEIKNRFCACCKKYVELWTNKTHITLPTIILEHKLKPVYSVYCIVYWELPPYRVHSVVHKKFS